MEDKLYKTFKAMIASGIPLNIQGSHNLSLSQSIPVNGKIRVALNSFYETSITLQENPTMAVRERTVTGPNS